MPPSSRPSRCDMVCRRLYPAGCSFLMAVERPLWQLVQSTTISHIRAPQGCTVTRTIRPISQARSAQALALQATLAAQPQLIPPHVLMAPFVGLVAPHHPTAQPERSAYAPSSQKRPHATSVRREPTVPWAPLRSYHALLARTAPWRDLERAAPAPRAPFKGRRVRQPAISVQVGTAPRGLPPQSPAQRARRLQAGVYRQQMSARYALSGPTASKARVSQLRVQPAQPGALRGSVPLSFAPCALV